MLCLKLIMMGEGGPCGGVRRYLVVPQAIMHLGCRCTKSWWLRWWGAGMRGLL